MTDNSYTRNGKATIAIAQDAPSKIEDSDTKKHWHHSVQYHEHRQQSLSTTRVLASLIFFTALLNPNLAHAHEYWISPVKNNWKTGQIFQADIRNGENFTGTAYPFNADALRSGGLISSTDRRHLTGRLGDYPAIQLPLNQPGLHLMLLETTARTVEYETQADFDAFLDYHGLTEMVDQYESVSDEGEYTQDEFITERYFRFVKNLFHVQDKHGTEPMPTLLAALTNDKDSPALETQGQLFELSIISMDTIAGDMSILLNFNGKPMEDRQIELFFKDVNTREITRTVERTDANGVVNFNTSQTGDYLLNSVWMVPDEQAGFDWTSYWASLTFTIGLNT